jgi:hypothetical protein
LVFAAVFLATLAVAFGVGLGLWHLRGSRPALLIGVVHGIFGSGALGVLLLALRGPARGVAAGAGSFGSIAAMFLAAALLTGIMVLVRRRNAPAVTVAIHSGLAITGYVVLLAWNALG